MDIVLSKNNFILDGPLGKFKIPSQKFPLKNNNIEIFHHENTADCTDQCVLDIYNDINFEIGRCFDNTELMIEKFKNNNIENIETYAGWLFVGYDFQIWHSFCVYNGNIILDFVSDLKYNSNIKIYNGNTMREKYLDFFKKQSEKTNTERFGFGKVDKMYMYVATKCSPKDAIKIFEKLKKAFPKHPSCKTFGLTELQKDLIQLT